MPSKKKYNARFPPARIKKIMQTDEDVGKVAAPVPVLISKALEIFLESLIIKSSHHTVARNAKTMTTAHIKQCIQNENTFDFLKDLVENVPDIAPGDEEDADSNHSSVVASSSIVTNNNRYHPPIHPPAGGGGEGAFSRSSSTASSSSYTEGQTKTKRRRGRPRKERSADVAGPSRSKSRKIVPQSSEDRTTSEDSSDNEGSFQLSDETNSSTSHSVRTMSQSSLSQDSRQRHPETTGQTLQKQPPQQPSFVQPIMPTFQVATSPCQTMSTSSGALGMGLYQMPTSSSNTGNNYDDDDDDDDYDT